MNFPIVQVDGQLLNLTDSILATFTENTFIYQFPQHHSLEDEEKILSREFRYSGFVFNREDKFGYLFSSIKDSVGKKMPIDSMLKRSAFGFLNIYDVVKESVLVSSYSNSGSSILSQIYSSKKVVDESYNDTTYLYFDKRDTRIQFPFSKRIDSVMNLTLIGARFLFNERYSVEHKIKIPKKEMTIDVFYLEESFISNSNFFLELFNLKKPH